jgi:predicted DsbA family dithiol-disulfide isomerase
MSIGLEKKYKFLLIISAAGLGIAIFSGLEDRIECLASFCGYFGAGCRETAAYKLLGVSVWLWGSAYYAVLVAVILFFRPALFWLVMVGLGVELSFIWIMISMKIMCIFCLANAVLVISLVVLSMEQKRIWPAVAVSLLVSIPTGSLLSRQNAAPVPKAPENPGTSVIARVGDQTITTMELESPLASRIHKLQQDMYTLKRDYLEGIINGILLSKEAREKGMTVDQLVNTISSLDEKATEQEVENYYQQNRLRWLNWKGSEEDLRHRIRIYLQDQKKRQRIAHSADTLKKKYPVTIYLEEPPLPFSNVIVGDSPTLGPGGAHVTIVEFSDYLCPACRKAHETTKKIRAIYAGRIRWVFKDYPLDRHKGAKKLAEAARCAEEQGKFWDFQDQLFAFKKAPTSEQLKTAAKQLGLDVHRFTQCYDDGKYVTRVEQDIEAARQSGVNATPSFIINGRLSPGALSLDDFKQRIDEELKKAGAQ